MAYGPDPWQFAPAVATIGFGDIPAPARPDSSRADPRAVVVEIVKARMPAYF